MKRRTKILLLFLVKATLLYTIFILLTPVLDGIYESAYRACGTFLYGRILKTGYVLYQPGKEKQFTHISIANSLHVHPDGTTAVAKDDINTREQGYLDTILLISLVLASPVPWKRRLFSLFSGIILLSGFVMLKLWLHLLAWCEHYSFLSLLNVTEASKNLIIISHDILYPMIYPSLFFVVALWMLFTFRKDDIGLVKE